ncbi:MAG TPA: hypothetical protein VFY50_03960, partial [Candidatus Nitrosocosmicus sp.]|nr:hypothetical protein [Candidatus Nitrosocosmicus sp.]
MDKPAETLVSNSSFQTIKVMSPGKVILFGEHFVVYGYPSLIASIEKHFKVTVQTPTKRKGEIIIKSNLGFTSAKRGGAIHISPLSLRPKFGDIITKLYKIIDYLTASDETVSQRLRKSYNREGFYIKL